MAVNRRISVSDVEALAQSTGKPVVLKKSNESSTIPNDTVDAGFQLKTLLIVLAIVVILRTDNPVSNLIDNVVISPLQKRARSGSTVLKPIVSVARLILPARRKALPFVSRRNGQTYEDGQY